MEQVPEQGENPMVMELDMADVLNPADVLHVIVGLHQTLRGMSTQLRQRDAVIAELRAQLGEARAHPTRRRKASAAASEPEGQVPIPPGTAAAVARVREMTNGKAPAHAAG